MIKFLLGFIPSPLHAYILAGAAIALFLAGFGLAHQLDEGRWQKHLRADAEAATAAQKAARKTEAKIAELTSANAGREAQAQERIINHTVYLTKEVTRYVPQTIARACVPWGIVRLFDASALGLDPADTGPPGGEPDDACSPVTTADLAAAIVANHGIARQNAEQLDALEADIRERTSAFNAKP